MQAGALFLPNSTIALFNVTVIFLVDLICFINYGTAVTPVCSSDVAVCLDERVPTRWVFLFWAERRSWCGVPLNQPFLQSDSRRS